MRRQHAVAARVLQRTANALGIVSGERPDPHAVIGAAIAEVCLLDVRLIATKHARIARLEVAEGCLRGILRALDGNRNRDVV